MCPSTVTSGDPSRGSEAAHPDANVRGQARKSTAAELRATLGIGGLALPFRASGALGLAPCLRACNARPRRRRQHASGAPALRLTRCRLRAYNVQPAAPCPDHSSAMAPLRRDTRQATSDSPNQRCERLPSEMRTYYPRGPPSPGPCRCAIPWRVQCAET